MKNNTGDNNMQTNIRTVWLLAVLGCIMILLVAAGNRKREEPFIPNIPKIWDEKALADLELPPPNSDITLEHISADYYYQIPIRPLFKSHPVYHPEHEPANYLDSLKQLAPVKLWNRSKLRTKADWIRAGEMVFDAPIDYDRFYSVATVRDAKWYSESGTPITGDGIMPFTRYVIREKGKIELGFTSCAGCHTRVMPDGSIIKGAQGNFPFERGLAAIRFFDKMPPGRRNRLMRFLFGAPWLEPDPMAWLDSTSADVFNKMFEAVQGGTLTRNGTNVSLPIQIPDLIGVKERRYLDHTGLVRHRDIGDLMRYAALNQGMNAFTHYNDFAPVKMMSPTGKLPPPSTQLRYSDEQLYAVALYLYSLKPPPNPNSFDSFAGSGSRDLQGGGVCCLSRSAVVYQQQADTGSRV